MVDKDKLKELFKITEIYILRESFGGEKMSFSLKTWGTAVELHAGYQINL